MYVCKKVCVNIVYLAIIFVTYYNNTKPVKRKKNNSLLFCCFYFIKLYLETNQLLYEHRKKYIYFGIKKK